MSNSQATIQYGKVLGDFTPKPMPKRDENAPVIDMNFNLMNQVVRANSDRVSSLTISIQNLNSAIGSLTVPSAANPSASIGLAAVNGSASTFMRSDAAPALSQAITPTWSALHTFTLAPKVSAFAGGGALMVVTDNAGQLGTQAIPSGATGADPTGTIGLSAVNGSASTYLRSDGAPALSQAIVPTWSGAHTFSTGIYPSYATNGSVGYLTKDRYSDLVPFNSGDWTNSAVTITSGSILQTSSGGVAHYAYRTYSNGFNDSGKGFYVKFKFTYTTAANMVKCGVSDSTTFANLYGITASGANTLVFINGSGTSSPNPTQSLVNGTTYTCYVFVYCTNSTNITITYQLWDSAGTTFLSSGSKTTTATFAGTYYLGIYCPQDTTAGELLDVRTYGMDTDTGGGLLTTNPYFTYNEINGCLGVGTPDPVYTVDISGTLRVSDDVLLSKQAASRALFTDSLSKIITNAITGTGNVVMSASPTLTGTITAAAATFSSTVTLSAARLLTAKGADVASANDITLGNGNHFQITGTTQINRILTTSWQAGSVIYLKFSGSLTVKHQGAANGSGFARLNLSGAVDFAATANDTLTLIYDGTDWFELARTVI